jgi:hypothetical protein
VEVWSEAREAVDNRQHHDCSLAGSAVADATLIGDKLGFQVGGIYEEIFQVFT